MATLTNQPNAREQRPMWSGAFTNRPRLGRYSKSTSADRCYLATAARLCAFKTSSGAPSAGVRLLRRGLRCALGR